MLVHLNDRFARFAEALSGVDARSVKVTHDLRDRGDISRVDLAAVLKRKAGPGAAAPSRSLTQDGNRLRRPPRRINGSVTNSIG
jgi:hypothetical protein